MASRDSISPLLATLLVLLAALLAFGQQQPPPQPYFDPSIPSCVKCEQDYANLNSCAEASHIFQNFSNVIWDPVGFFEVAKCACGDSFQRAYPLCIECFAKTNQTETVFNTEVPPAIEDIRSVCQTGSTLTGNSTEYDRRGDAVGNGGANWQLETGLAFFTVLLAMST